MAKLPAPIGSDPTLDAVDRALEARSAAEPRRGYLGASAIGDPCDAKIWYGFRWAAQRVIKAPGVRAIEDGHRTEDLTAERLRMVPGVQLWTEDPDEPGRQIGFSDGHFAGNCDGIIIGILQAPETPHVWENKAVNEKKQQKLVSLKTELGEKEALKAWDLTYWGQAQVYMHRLGLERHYLTCDSPGGRSTVSVRTDYDPAAAIRLEERAKRIATAERPGTRISDRPDWYECKFCDFAEVCHAKALPEVHCRTCAHVTPTDDGQWRCERHDKFLTLQEQIEGCTSHLFHPVFVDGEPVESGPDHITYKMRNGKSWTDGPK